MAQRLPVAAQAKLVTILKLRIVLLAQQGAVDVERLVPFEAAFVGLGLSAKLLKSGLGGLGSGAEQKP